MKNKERIKTMSDLIDGLKDEIGRGKYVGSKEGFNLLNRAETLKKQLCHIDECKETVEAKRKAEGQALAAKIGLTTKPIDILVFRVADEMVEFIDKCIIKELESQGYINTPEHEKAAAIEKKGATELYNEFHASQEGCALKKIEALEATNANVNEELGEMETKFMHQVIANEAMSEKIVRLENNLEALINQQKARIKNQDDLISKIEVLEKSEYDLKHSLGLSRRCNKDLQERMDKWNKKV